MPLFILLIIALAAYIFVFGNILFDKHLGAKSFSNVALLCNIVPLAIIFMNQTRLPMGGFFEAGAETALILGAIYTVFIPVDLKKLSLFIIGGCIVCLIVSLFGGLAPHLAAYISWWLQFSVQAHLLAGGLLLFSLICYGSLVFGKTGAAIDPNEITGFARAGLLVTVLVFILGILCTQMWYFTVSGELLLWNKRLLLNFALLCLLLLPLISQISWFKDLRNKHLFDGMVTVLVFIINLYEWGGLA